MTIGLNCHSTRGTFHIQFRVKIFACHLGGASAVADRRSTEAYSVSSCDVQCFLPHCSWAHARSLSLACLCVSVCIEVRVRFGPLPWEHARLGAGATCAGIVLRVFFSACTALNPRNECAADSGVFLAIPHSNHQSEWPVTHCVFVGVPSNTHPKHTSSCASM